MASFLLGVRTGVTGVSRFVEEAEEEDAGVSELPAFLG